MTLLILAASLILGPSLVPMDYPARLERAVASADADALRDLRGELGRPREIREPAALYTLAYVDWRLAGLLDGKQRKQLALEAQEALERLLEHRPGDAEALALLGSVYGMRITGWLSGMSLGRKAEAALREAADRAPDNPRVALQHGVSAFFSPRAFGGGLDRAETRLRHALDLFAREPGDRPWPDWGHVDAWAWLGQVLAAKGDVPGARAAYTRALELEPDHLWVRDVLLPELD